MTCNCQRPTARIAGRQRKGPHHTASCEMYSAELEPMEDFRRRLYAGPDAIGSPPPYPGTRLHAIRIPDPLWAAMLEVCAAEETSISEVTRECYERRVKRHEQRTKKESA